MLNYFNQLSNGEDTSQSKSKGVPSEFVSMVERTLTLVSQPSTGGGGGDGGGESGHMRTVIITSM